MVGIRSLMGVLWDQEDVSLLCLEWRLRSPGTRESGSIASIGAPLPMGRFPMFAAAANPVNTKAARSSPSELPCWQNQVRRRSGLPDCLSWPQCPIHIRAVPLPTFARSCADKVGLFGRLRPFKTIDENRRERQDYINLSSRPIISKRNPSKQAEPLLRTPQDGCN